MNVTGVRHVGLVIPNIDCSRTFYQDTWGLEEVAFDDGVSYLRSQNDEPFILALYPGERRSLHHIALSLPDRQTVDEAAQYLASVRVPLLDRPGPLAQFGSGYGFHAVDPEGRVIQFSAEVEQAARAPDVTLRSGPIGIGHVVLNTRDFQTTCTFFTETLGFRISDWSEGHMVFLRCNTAHHSIALNRAPHASLNHVAFDMPTIDDVMRTIGRLRKAQAGPIWGPGRHAPGSYVFCYTQEPSGFVVEVETEGQKIEDEASHEVRVFARKPELMDLWGTSGFTSPEARAATLGEPDPGLLPITQPIP